MYTSMKTEKLVHKLARTAVIALASGITGAGLLKLFMEALDYLSAKAAAVTAVPGYLVPLAGAALTGLIILRHFPGAGGDGTEAYIEAMHSGGESLRGADTIMKIPATLITLGFYGSGGIVGTLSRIGAGLSSAACRYCIRLFRIKQEETFRIAAVCGVSAVVSAIFHSPLGGAFFATEITRKNTIIYSDLFPAVLTGCIAVYLSSLFGQNPIFVVGAPPFGSGINIILLSAIAAVISGVVGILFIASYERTGEIFNSLPFGQPGRALIAGVILALFWAAGGTDVLGTSIPLFKDLASGDASFLSEIPFYSGNIFMLAALLLILKITATSVTVGSGLSGGVTGPLIIIGACFASVFCSVAAIEPGTLNYSAVLCACISAILSSALNIPIAAALIAVSIFDHSYIIPAALGAILPFFIFRGRTVFVYPGEGPADEFRGNEGITGSGMEDL